MKPNDQAYQAALRATSDSFSAYQIQNALDAAYAAQFQSEDYAGLIKNIRNKNRYCSTDAPEAADALEALLAERDDAIAEREAMKRERDLARARVEELEDILDGIGVYGSDTLSGRVGGPADKDWYRDGVREMRNRARTALEGVTEPASPWRDIESAPKDGTWIFIYEDSWHGAIKAKWDAIDGVDRPFMGWVFQDEFLCIGCAEGCLGYSEDIEDGYMPTHWMPLPEPPRMRPRQSPQQSGAGNE